MKCKFHGSLSLFKNLKDGFYYREGRTKKEQELGKKVAKAIYYTPYREDWRRREWLPEREYSLQTTEIVT